MMEDLRDRFEALDTSMRKLGYSGHEADVLTLIEDCRSVIEEQKDELGQWEIELLSHAEKAVYSNMLRLALVCAEKALRVSQLPRNEYEAGFNYGR